MYESLVLRGTVLWSVMFCVNLSWPGNRNRICTRFWPGSSWLSGILNPLAAPVSAFIHVNTFCKYMQHKPHTCNIGKHGLWHSSLKFQNTCVQRQLHSCWSQTVVTTQSNRLNLIQYIGIPTAGIHASAWAHSRPQWVFLTITEVHTVHTEKSLNQWAVNNFYITDRRVVIAKQVVHYYVFV